MKRRVLRFGLQVPQSNQRGIETLWDRREEALIFGPQSNQRGIETAELGEKSWAGWQASIEPAWD